MKVSRKGDVFVKKIGFDHGKQISASHGLEFFSGRKPAVVPHDAAHKPGPQKHVGALHQNHVRALFLALTAAAHPAQPPPTTMTLMVSSPFG